jgi:hypothetical protein
VQPLRPEAGEDAGRGRRLHVQAREGALRSRTAADFRQGDRRLSAGQLRQSQRRQHRPGCRNQQQRTAAAPDHIIRTTRARNEARWLDLRGRRASSGDQPGQVPLEVVEYLAPRAAA